MLVVDFGENRECVCGRLIFFDKASLGVGFLKEGLQDEHLGRVVMPVQLLHAPVLVTVDAANAVHAVLRIVERPAVLALVVVDVDSEGGLGELVLSVGEAALFIVATVAGLNPVFAHLGLVLSIVVVIDSRLFGHSRCGCWRARVEGRASLARVEALLAEGGLSLLLRRWLEGRNFGLAVK